jgi:hypothetical protein
VKRLNGMDAMLLYSETPNVHTHTLKIAVRDAADQDSEFTFDLFRSTLLSRLLLCTSQFGKLRSSETKCSILELPLTNPLLRISPERPTAVRSGRYRDGSRKVSGAAPRLTGSR